MFLQSQRLAGARSGVLFSAYENAALDSPCSWASALKNLQAESVAGMLTKVLADLPFSDFYWECRPVAWRDLSTQQFDFVVLDAHGSLNRTSASSSAFAEHLSAAKSSVASFPNLGRDATLVVPVHDARTTADAYGHLSQFLRYAPPHQHMEFWRTVGQVMEAEVRKAHPEPVWLSTAGNGVPWVHVRADSWPKYVKHEEFIRHSSSDMHTEL